MDKDYEKKREEKYKEESRQRLVKILKKKIETTMIGSLSSIEEHFGFLWNSGEKMTPDQQIMFDIYQKVRSEILDKGNTQSRNLEAETSQYEIKWLRYSTIIPVKNIQ
jgi:hypothetical protein